MIESDSSEAWDCAYDIGAVHLGMAPDNVGARVFYDRLGFTEIPVGDPTVVYLGRSTAAS